MKYELEYTCCTYKYGKKCYIYIYINYIYTISGSFNNACSWHIVVTTNEIVEYDKCSGMTNCLWNYSSRGVSF